MCFSKALALEIVSLLLNVSPRSVVLALVWGGIFCGVGDLLFAFVLYGLKGATPLGIMQSIAGGLLGRAAAQSGGLPTALLGVVLHFIISFGASAVYSFASLRFHTLTKHAVTCGLLYGVLVFFFMNMVVLPLSAYHARAFPPPLTPIPILGHMFIVGLPIALAARHFLSVKEPSPQRAGRAIAAP